MVEVQVKGRLRELRWISIWRVGTWHILSDRECGSLGCGLISGGISTPPLLVVRTPPPSSAWISGDPFKQAYLVSSPLSSGPLLGVYCKVLLEFSWPLWFLFFSLNCVDSFPFLCVRIWAHLVVPREYHLPIFKIRSSVFLQMSGPISLCWVWVTVEFVGVCVCC